MALDVGSRLGHYDVTALIGEGGMGQVYQATDTTLNRQVTGPSCAAKTITGNPNPKHISTSYIERSNLTLRMGSRRFTRLTNGFSKKVENHAHAVAIHYTYYNWCRIHKSLRVTPAIEAGLTDHVWELEELVGLLGR